MNDPAFRKMINAAKKRGYITYDELNDALPKEIHTTDQIEDIMSMLTDQGIDVVESISPNDDK